MKISTEIGSAARLVGEEKAVEMIAKAGFEAWDFSMFVMGQFDAAKDAFVPSDHPLGGSGYLKFARKLKQIGLDYGIVCNQSHAPFPSTMGGITYLKRAIECTAEAGGKLCVIHPNNHGSVEENAALYEKLLPFAKECGVKIATENMFNWDRKNNEALPSACSSGESFKALLEAVKDEFFVACVDVGHAEMRGLHTSAPKMIECLGDKVQALHIHDNDQWHDCHQLPFSMSLDFHAMIKSLKEIRYQGDLTLEADSYLMEGGYTPDMVSRGLENMATVAKKLKNEYIEISD